MYFANQTQLLNTLDDDWSNLLKIIKKRQQLHLSFLQKNQSIVNKNRNDKDQEQLAEELQEIKLEFSSVKELNTQLEVKQKQIVDKYQSLTTSFDDVVKLMSRVASKVLEITQCNLDKLRVLDNTMFQKHSRMKKNLINMLNQKQKLNLQHFFNIILDYNKNKLTTQLSKTQKLIKVLQNKDFHRLKDINQSRDRPRIGSVQKIRQLMIERRKEYSLNKQERSHSKRHDSSSHKNTKNKGLFYNLYGIMNLTKYQMGEQYAGSNQQKKQRIFNDLMYRNRKNKDHILIFRLLQPNLDSKTKSFEQRLQRRSCQKQRYQNKSFTQNVIIINNNKKKKQHTMTQSITFNQYLATQTQLTKKSSQDQMLKKRMSGTKTKFFGKEGEDFPYLCNKTMVTQDNQKIGNIDLIKKESLFENRKRKLPQINRGASLDNKSSRIPKLSNTKGTFRDDVNNIEEDILKTNKRKQKWFKDDKLSTQRTKMILKNVEVGGIPMNPRKQQWFVKKEEGVIVKQRKKTDTNIQTNTAYCKRTLTKFFDTKMNGFN